MILAAGLTPAWQQILEFDQLQPGEVNRASRSHWCASGKVLNVGIALKHLAAKSLTLTAGGGWSRVAMEGELLQLQVPHRWIDTRHPSRVCTTVIDIGGRVTTELVENTPEFSFAELAAFQQACLEMAADAELIVFSGSLPTGTPSTYYRDLVARISGRVILDVRGPELLEALPTRPFIVKPNRAELARTLDRDLTRDEDLVQAMQQLNEQGARWVVITDGPSPVWISSASEVWMVDPPPVSVVNPIGSGDSLTAGMAFAIEQGADVPEAVRYGIAAAADNAEQMLPCRLRPDRIANQLLTVPPVAPAPR